MTEYFCVLLQAVVDAALDQLMNVIFWFNGIYSSKAGSEKVLLIMLSDDLMNLL